MKCVARSAREDALPALVRFPPPLGKTTMFIGTKVTIGAFVLDDYPAMYCWANDVGAARHNGAFRPVNLTDVLQLCDTAGKDPSRVMLAIRRRNETQIIGYLHIQNISAVHRSADIGIRIGQEQWRGRGYGKEALMMGLAYCWQHLNLQRVSLIVFRKNARAINAYKAAGFRKEGLMKKLLFIDGEWVDVLLMAAFRPSPKRARRIAAELRDQKVPAAARGDLAAQRFAAA
jgi:ribosomal-protein-alanine N-acetyltransferase